MAKNPYDHQWRIARLAILERDRYVCQIRGRTCTKVATQVDHIVGLEDGGARLDPTNLRASCRKCNTARSAYRTLGMRRDRHKSSDRWWET